MLTILQGAVSAPRDYCDLAGSRLRIAMDVKEIRRRNLSALLQAYKDAHVSPQGKPATNKEFAAFIDVAEKHLSQMLGGHRDMGDDVARRIEGRLRKPHGWMDSVHTELPERLKRVLDAASGLSDSHLDQLQAFAEYLRSKN